jgi:hypothetical protein
VEKTFFYFSVSFTYQVCYTLSMNLKHLCDKTLLNDTKSLVFQERTCITKILHHLKEIETRRLFADLKFGSLFEYAVKELGYSEAAANRRIHSARLLKDMPELEKKFESGELNLTNATMASQLFKGEKIKDKEIKKKILKKIEGKTKKAAEKALQEFSTKKSEGQVLRIKVSDKTAEKFENLKRLLGSKELSHDELMDYIITAATEKIEKTDVRPRTAPAQRPDARVVNTQLKRAVYARDKGKCQNCGTNYKLEYDHIKPFSMGGKTTEENLRLLCFSCNQRQRIRMGLGIKKGPFRAPHFH